MVADVQNVEKSNEDDNNETKNNDAIVSGKCKDKTFKQKVVKMFKNITVEPVLACYIMPSVLASLAVQNLNLEKACRVNQNYSESICDQLIRQDVENLTDEVQEVQKLVATMVAWKSPLQTLIPAFLIVFVGTWSDRTGRRKPCMMMPLVGELLTSLGLILCTFYFVEWPLEVAGVIEAVPPALTGGWTTMFMAVFSHISDHTTLEDRTFRIGIVNVFASLGIPIGTALSGVLLKSIGFYGVFMVSICIYVIGFTYAFFYIKDKRRIEIVDNDKCCCVEFLNPKHVNDTFMVAFKPRSGSRRVRVMLLLIVFIVLIGPMYGEVGVLYLFTRYKFNYTEVDYSIFATYGVTVALIGTTLALTILTRRLKVDDALLGVIAGVSKIAASFVYAFAPTRFWLMLGPLVDSLSGTGIIAMRSIATKLVDPGEAGRINSLFGVVEAIVPIIYSPMYSRLYVETIGYFPGAFFLLGALLTIPSIAVFMGMYILQKRDNLEDRDATQKENRMKEKEKYANDNEVTKM